MTIRATGEVAADGQSFTVEVGGVEGCRRVSTVRGTVNGTGLAVEAMGTPVGSIEESFGSFEDGTEVTEGTAMAEATEVAAPPTTS